IHAAFAVDDPKTAVAITGALFESGEIRPVFAMLRTLYASRDMESDFREMQKRSALNRIEAMGVRPVAAQVSEPAATPGPVVVAADETGSPGDDPVSQG